MFGKIAVEKDFKNDERQVFWILGYFTNVKFPPFRHFTIIKNISQLNVRHAFQASYPSTIVPKTWHAFKYPENLTLVKNADKIHVSGGQG